ncbi:FHA domain-containing protein [Nocardia yunnanensis]|uniref:FHA domain-containing protein n=1 Tax=Nocardia yunnanensis TaxID=2382165 RepID=A0A386ZAC4_9NOCA|nr:FHA domain-containing protein [Nocardia yunnanensis]AYF74123.1 FHA domain-containing protein [Nocardia yunnanensis]
MGRIPTTVGLVSGTGLVARFGNVVLFLHGDSASTERILGAAEAAASAADPGVAVAQRLAATVFSAGATPPAFGVIAPTADGLLILLRGATTAAVDGPEGARSLSGARALTWVDEIVRDPVRRLTVRAETAGGAIAHTDLRSGVVVGGGFVVHAPVSGVTAPPPPGTAPPKESPAGENPPSAAKTGRGQVVSSTPDRAAEPSNPRAVATTPAPGSRPAADSGAHQRPRPLDQRVRMDARSDPAPETRATPAVEPQRPSGPRAARPDLVKRDGAEPGSTPRLPGPEQRAADADRANRPDPDDQPPTAAYVSDLEEAAPHAQAAAPPTTSAVPTADGVLTSAEGAVYPLDRPYVIGRDPMIDESVRRAVASPIVIARDRHVSRVHARVYIENGLVYVRDAGTPGGTFVAAPGAPDWVRVGQRAMELKVGWSLRIGEKVLTYRAG